MRNEQLPGMGSLFSSLTHSVVSVYVSMCERKRERERDFLLCVCAGMRLRLPDVSLSVLV